MAGIFDGNIFDAGIFDVERLVGGYGGTGGHRPARRRAAHTIDPYAYPRPWGNRDAEAAPIVEQIAIRQIEQNLTSKQALAELLPQLHGIGVTERREVVREALEAERQRILDDDDIAAITVIALLA